MKTFLAKGGRAIQRQAGRPDRDFVSLGIALSAIILLVGTAGTLLPQLWRNWQGGTMAPDRLLTNALLLNIALLLLGWKRYRDLRREVGERRHSEALARELAEIDPLTACLNRRSGTPAIDHLHKAALARGDGLAVVMVDLDNFKQINDFHGHQSGDLVLAEVSRRIRASLPHEAVLARIGGDEFVCALPFADKNEDRIEGFALNLIEAVSSPIHAGEHHFEATVSVGIATSASAEVDAPTLLHRADIAMYHAKKRGRNRHFWFEARMEDELRLRGELESGIRSGIVAGEFVPYYEQQIDLETGELVGFEMLARWHSPKYGVVSPETFIPIAEEIDLIAPLSEGLIRQALTDARQWAPHLTLSVNISPLQLRDAWFAQKLLQLLVETGFPAQRLELEITESCLHENIGAVRAIVSSLRNQGIRISLDDFGTGYSSLSQLRNLPFDRLKIDRSFVAEMAREGKGSELVEAIISLGRTMSLPVTAEGVETEELLSRLKAMGQLKGQGYLYGRPEDARHTRLRLEELGLLANPADAAHQPAATPASTPAQQAQRKAG